jgi:tetratricopeptide (TPR) repeat protein
VLAEMDKTFLNRLLDKPNLSSDDMKKFADVSTRFRDGDFPGVISAYQSLPPILRTNLAATVIHITALQRTGDNDAYKSALKEAAGRFKSASFQFMLIDLYFLDKEYDKAVECLDVFMQAVGRDAALLALRSLVLYAKHDFQAARTSLQEALRLEPDCVYAHSKGLDVLLAAKDFAATRDSMIFLEKNAGFDFKGALTDPLWDDFKKAPESARWR